MRNVRVNSIQFNLLRNKEPKATYKCQTLFSSKSHTQTHTFGWLLSLRPIKWSIMQKKKLERSYGLLHEYNEWMNERTNKRTTKYFIYQNRYNTVEKATSLWTLGCHKPVIPVVTFLTPLAWNSQRAKEQRAELRRLDRKAQKHLKDIWRNALH